MWFSWVSEYFYYLVTLSLLLLGNSRVRIYIYIYIFFFSIDRLRYKICVSFCAFCDISLIRLFVFPSAFRDSVTGIICYQFRNYLVAGFVLKCFAG